MLKQIDEAYAHNLTYAQKLLADVTDDIACDQPQPNMNHPLWVAGHLAHVADKVVGGLVLALDAEMSDEQSALFNHASKPESAETYALKLNHWIGVLERAHGRVSDAVLAADPAILDQEVPVERFRKRFPTVGRCLLHMMIAHEMQHLGQLSAWRRVRGMPAV